MAGLSMNIGETFSRKSVGPALILRIGSIPSSCEGAVSGVYFKNFVWPVDLVWPADHD
jgi:hypothetical protein